MTTVSFSVILLTFGSIQIDRKLVKQTVMTSVYGVTYIGAREQIKRRLEEKGQITDDRLLFTAACYAAKVSISRIICLDSAVMDCISHINVQLLLLLAV